MSEVAASAFNANPNKQKTWVINFVPLGSKIPPQMFKCCSIHMHHVAIDNQ